jgi:multiple sugar transport system substrate-binding protein
MKLKTSPGCTLVLIVPLLLAACQPKNRSISFMVFGDPAELAAYQQLVAGFQTAWPPVHPEITVDLIHIPSQADYRTRLSADLAAGVPADVILLNYRRYAAFAARGVLEPLGPYLAKSQLIQESDFYSQAIAPFRWQGELICIPQNISSLVVYYNRDLFTSAGLPEPQPGWTWDDFLAIAQALTRDLDGDGQIDQFGLGVEPSLFRVAPFLWQNGAELVDDYFTPTRLMLDTPEALEALQFFIDLQVQHQVVPNASEEAAEPSEDRFLNGRLGMFLNSRRGVPTYRTITAFDWDVAPLPQKRQVASILHADAYCLPSASQNKDAAWIFIEYANSPAGQAIVAASGRTVPSLRSVAESSAFLDTSQKPAHTRLFLDSIPTLRGVPVYPNWVDIEELAGEELRRAFYGETDLFEAVLTAIRRAQPYFGENE